ncbi:hypothetical protein LZ554_003722 [Drepanopeziza brunnea f. sp. 'monogermtubi']|nr:hypothetical protein LZ554_003722 [Drepanopeziza brunnea f. sp. 'monogermtubi']
MTKWDSINDPFGIQRRQQIELEHTTEKLSAIRSLDYYMEKAKETYAKRMEDAKIYRKESLVALDRDLDAEKVANAQHANASPSQDTCKTKDAHASTATLPGSELPAIKANSSLEPSINKPSRRKRKRADSAVELQVDHESVLRRNRSDEESPAIIVFEIEEKSVWNDLAGNNFVAISAESVPMDLRLYEGMKGILRRFRPKFFRADDSAWYADFGGSDEGKIAANICFNDLKGRKFDNRYEMKMRLVGRGLTVLESTL